MHVTILAIESSCDDTSVAILRDGKILSNETASQWIHVKYGGVVPEAASRLHVESIIPLTESALLKAGISLTDLTAIAVTRGPGLLGALLVGITHAKGLSLSLGIPLIEVNHLHAHILSLFIDHQPVFPMLCLTVSGGHTQLLQIENAFDIELLGQTKDDAAGEAFDKCGKLLGLPYPAGPHMDRLAQQGNPRFFFPCAQLADYDFSYSGLKTSVLYFLREELRKNPNFIEENLVDLCASIQLAILTPLFSKVQKASKDRNISTIGIAGGVSANSGLRKGLAQLAETHNWQVITPKISYCTDNAAMIAMVGYAKYLKSEYSALEMNALARYPVT